MDFKTSLGNFGNVEIALNGLGASWNTFEIATKL